MKKKFSLFAKVSWPFVAIVILSFWALRPLFAQGFFTMHDDQQIARLFELNEAIRNGQFPVRWVSHLGFGFGYPLFVFYPPLVYYFGFLFHFFGFSLIASTKIVMGIGFLLSGLFMYLWVNKHHGKVAGVTAALLYIYAPYHIVDLYVRGAFSEFFSFVWIPAIFWVFDNLSEKRTPGWLVFSSLSVALLMITHNLIALPFISFLGIYVFYLLYKERTHTKDLFIKFALCGMIALGLSAFFWLPSLLEKSYTLVDVILTKELASYKIHFLDPMQLWQAPWGYGGSGEGIGDGMSLKVGKVHLLTSVLAVIAMLSVLVFRRKKSLEIPHTGIVATLLVLSLFMTIPLSKFLWDTFQPLDYLQFPWRFLVFATVFASFLGGAFVGYMRSSKIRFLHFVIAIGIVSGAIFLLRPYIQPQQYLRVTDNYYIENQDIEWRVSLKSFEYMAKETATTISPLQTTIIAIARDEIPKYSYQSISQELVVREIQNLPHYKKYQTNGKGVFQINTNYFPGWNVFIDGKKTTIIPRGKFHVITIQVPVGSHIVEAKFENTLIRTIANSITIASSISMGILLVLKKKKHEKV